MSHEGDCCKIRVDCVQILPGLFLLMLQSALNMVAIDSAAVGVRACVVVVCPLGASTLLRLGAVLWTAGVPFLVCRTYGLIGYMRLVVQEHTGEEIRGHAWGHLGTPR